jgi:hypothetical protein
VAGFSVPQDGLCGSRNSLRQPGISQLDMGLFKVFKLSERFNIKFKWEVFNVLNHGMFAFSSGNIKTCKIQNDDTQPNLNHAIPGTCAGGFGTFFATPDVGIGLNPILGTGAQRNMQFGLAVSF